MSHARDRLIPLVDEGPGNSAAGEQDVRLGLRVNLAQFILLAVVNFFVGGMVGTERTAAVSDATHPGWRSAALGIYRFWRDAGYAIGALIGGVTAALASLDAAIAAPAPPNRRSCWRSGDYFLLAAARTGSWH